MTARRILRLLPALAVLAIAAAFAACGSKEGTDVSEGEPVQLGDLQFNVEFSRFLNPDDVEDHGYLVGQPAPGPDQLYLGIFVEIINKNKQSAVNIPTGWKITDTTDQSYFPLPSQSPYALPLGAPIGPQDQAPALDSTAQVGPTGGAMVLFSIPTSANDNRPLVLDIPGPGGPAKITLDL
jgi:hypothetical protein